MHNSSDSAEADASEGSGGDAAMDEEEFLVGGMDIDEGNGNGKAPREQHLLGLPALPERPRKAFQGKEAVGIDEDMSEVAEIMLNLKVCD